jgi:Domain of unknown function (DUF4114)
MATVSSHRSRSHCRCRSRANSDFSNVYTAYSLSNADKVDHIRLLGDNTFGFEDLYGGGDRDFNNIIVKVTFNS